MYNLFINDKLRRIKIKGISLTIEHTDKLICIKDLQDDWVGENNSKLMCMDIHNSMQGLFANISMFRQYFNISLFHLHYMQRKSDRGLVTIKHPVELSIRKAVRTALTFFHLKNRNTIGWRTNLKMLCWPQSMSEKK